MGTKKLFQFWTGIPVAFLMLFNLSLANQTAKSKVTAVTVYADRASITRTAEVKLSAGVNTVEFADLPVAFADQSLRVSGVSESDVKILDVQIKTVFVDTVSSDRVGELQSKLSVLMKEEAVLTKKMGVLESQMNFIDSLRIYFARSAASGATKSSFDDWGKMVGFLEKNMNEINDATLETDSKLRDTRSRIGSIQSEIRQTQGYPRRSEKHVIVTLSSDKAGTSTLELSYLLGGASWTPIYEVRAATGEKEISVTYSGMVRQVTGEDWLGVAVTLSTAQPSVIGAPPDLSPWQIGAYQKLAPTPALGMQQGLVEDHKKNQVSIAVPIHWEQGLGNSVRGRVFDRETGEPLVGATVSLLGTSLGASTDLNGEYLISRVPSGTYEARVTYVGYNQITSPSFEVNSSSGVRSDYMLGQSTVQASAVYITSERPTIEKAWTSAVSAVAVPASVVESRISSATFTIAAPADIPSDNNPHKVTIAMANIAVKLSYTSVPKLTGDTYLTASAENTTEYPFLAGTASVFLDNSFVATTPMKSVFPNEEFSSYLGTDAGVKVARKLVRDFTESTGLLTKKTKRSFEYLITVENEKKVPIDLAVKDQIPVPNDEKVVVEVESPDPSQIKPDEQGVVTWNLNLKPQEKRELRLAFSIEYPVDFPVTGIR